MLHLFKLRQKNFTVVGL